MKKKAEQKTTLASNIIWQIFGIPFALLWFLLGLIAYTGVVLSIPRVVWLIYYSPQEIGALYTLYEKISLATLAVYFTCFGPYFGTQCIKIARFILWPFGKEVKTQLLNKPRILIGNLLWHISGRFAIVFLHLAFEKDPWLLTYLHFHIIGMPLFIFLHLIVGLLLCATLLFIPFGKQLFKVVQLSFLPFGAQIFLPSQKKQDSAYT